MKRPADEVVKGWLDEVASAMGGYAGPRRDVLLELETTIYDRIEERAGGRPVPPELVQDVLDAMGDPGEVGASFAPAAPMVAAHHTRPFLVNVFILFAAHFLLVMGATVAGQDLELPPLRIEAIAHPTNLLELFARAVEVLLFDLGTVLCLFVVFRRLKLLLRFPHTALAVRPSPRRCIESACFFTLVLVVVNFLRDDLLALYLRSGSEVLRVPLVGPGVVDNLWFFNAWLGLAITKELVYASFGERKTTLLLDVLAHGAGLFCLLRMVATKRLVDLSQAQEFLGPIADGFGAVVNTVFGLLTLAAAAFLAGRLMRRVFRLALLRS